MDDLVYFYPLGHQAHTMSGHSERPERVETICRALDEKGWWQPYQRLSPLVLSSQVMAAVHDPSYLTTLKAYCLAGEMWNEDTYTTPASFRLALQAAGGGAAVAAAVWQRQAARGFALTRPPGHHATRKEGMGFCLLNNIALAAEHLLQEHGAARLAIIDLDLHHGNGTQDIFWFREDVLYISTHQSPLYPGTGNLLEVGEGPGKGCNMNIPLPPGSGDEAYHQAMDSLILPLLDRFQPEMLLVSLGFDAHWKDPFGHLRLSAQGYGSLVRDLARWADRVCQGRIALFLEGGYEMDALFACAQAVAAALLGLPYQDRLGPSPRPEGKSWRAVIDQAREIWK